jgi:hypothetical protein
MSAQPAYCLRADTPGLRLGQMVEADDWDCLETKKLRRLVAPVTGDDLTAFVDQNGRVEAEGVDASRNRPHLDPTVLARIARIRAKGIERNEASFPTPLACLNFRSLALVPAGPLCLDRAGSEPHRCPFRARARRRRKKLLTYLRYQID